MRNRIINILKSHPIILGAFWNCMRLLLRLISILIPVQEKRVVFASFGGRKFDDSPRAIYEEMLDRNEFSDWDYVWAFVNPDQFEIPKGRKVKIDTLSFFSTILSSRVWVSNSGMDRGIGFHKKGIIKIETWHGSPIKKIGGEENKGSMLISNDTTRVDNEVIRCAQSDYDLEIFARINKVNKDCFLLSDLPRNDILAQGISEKRAYEIKRQIGITDDRKVLLYMPTYREYLVDKNMDIYFTPPLVLKKWKDILGDQYVLLMRAHYAVSRALGVKNDGFVFDVTNYPVLSDLYLISDVLISDYSSSFFDYSILDRPMICFAYDLEEYSEMRGLYFDLSEELPCKINKTEDEVIAEINTLDYSKASMRTHQFHMKYAPYAGHASEAVIEKLVERLRG